MALSTNTAEPSPVRALVVSARTFSGSDSERIDFDHSGEFICSNVIFVSFCFLSISRVAPLYKILHNRYRITFCVYCIRSMRHSDVSSTFAQAVQRWVTIQKFLIHSSHQNLGEFHISLPWVVETKFTPHLYRCIILPGKLALGHERTGVLFKSKRWYVIVDKIASRVSI